MPSSLPITPKPAAYKRYLTSLWHTRWLHAAAVALLWHLSVSAVSGDWYTSISSFFWAFFPLGPAGFRAALFWITSLIVFMIPLSTFKIGQRCTPSNWTTIRNAVTSPIAPATTFLWYATSAFWFCQVFVYFSPTSQDLSWIISGGYNSPDKLNERPLYLFAFFQVLGTVHALWHIRDDKSTMPLRTTTLETKDGASKDETVVARILDRAPIMARNAVVMSAGATLFTTCTYSWIFRSTLWHFTMTFAKAFANMARSDAFPPGSYYFGGIIVKGIFIGFLLSMTWQLDMLLFEVFMTTEPLKNGLPLSAASKDPNGTLLNGLTRKSDLIRSFAFWELFLISVSHPVRRKEIFGDIERPNTAPMSTLMVNTAINVINSIEVRMTTFEAPSGSLVTKDEAQVTNGSVQHLPRLLPNAVPAKNPILLASNPAASNSGFDRVGNYISHEARVLGSSKTPWSPPIEKGKQLAIEYSSPSMQEFRSRTENVQQSSLGRYLLTSPIRLIKSIVLGSPVGNATLIVHATRSATNLLVASLQEDTYGKAVACVPPTIQALTRAIFVVEHVVRKHTEGTVTEADAQNLGDVLTIHENLKTCLKELLEKFGSFLRDVGLSIRDLNEAHKAAEDLRFFEILQPVVAGRRPQNDSAQPQREMEDVSQHARSRHASKAKVQEQKSEVPVSRRSRETAGQEPSANVKRPGRLFSQLDSGSAMDKAWKERRKSQERRG